MAKLVAPLFGISARGSLAGAITYQRAKGLNVAKSIPTHRDSASPAQLAHRWLYSLGIALWNAMTPSERAVYQAMTPGTNDTPMAAWLRVWLTTTPNLALGLPIEEGQGAVTRDLSAFATPGTIVGATWVRVASHYALSFDGIDDYLQVDPSAQLDFTTGPFSIVTRLTPQGFDLNRNYLARGTGGAARYTMGANTVGQGFAATATGGVGADSRTSNAALAAGTPVLFAANYDAGQYTMFIDGLQDNSVLSVGDPIPSNAGLFRLGHHPNAGLNWYEGIWHWIAIFNRELTAAEHREIHRSLPY